MTVDSEQKLEPPPLRSVHSTSFAHILDELGLSLLVTTYQAGKLVILRSDEGRLNTHFRTLVRPMGMAVQGNRLAIGTSDSICEFANVRAAARRLEPPEKHDACFLPRLAHVTGDIHVHEMAWANNELWFVNTTFSCLCTLDRSYSFVPRWRPSFISALTPEDRCHLNGLAMVEGKPRYVTALGETDEDRGWRVNKKDGGILIDIVANRIVARGLSMPHSPRWHAGRLWVLDSGSGSLGTVDPDTGRYEPITKLPGFTRGIDFVGNLAFVGLSQVRETAVFSGIAITETLKERTCGVWVVDIDNGETVAFLRFEDAVQEIFAVQVLPGIRFPDLINDDSEIVAHAYVLPDDALAAVPPSFRSNQNN